MAQEYNYEIIYVFIYIIIRIDTAIALNTLFDFLRKLVRELRFFNIRGQDTAMYDAVT